jgi:hypothetical protein
MRNILPSPFARFLAIGTIALFCGSASDCVRQQPFIYGGYRIDDSTSNFEVWNLAIPGQFSDQRKA